MYVICEMTCTIRVKYVLATGIKMFPVTQKQELYLQEIDKQQMIEKGVYKICKSDLEKIQQEIRIKANMDYVENVYGA